jgi:hypothetical protein
MSSPFSSNGSRAIDLLKAESNISQASRRVLKLPSGAEFEFWMTPITLSQRKAAMRDANSDEQLEINLQLLIAKAKDENGQPLFHSGELAELRRQVTAGIVADLFNQLYADGEQSSEDDKEEVVSPKSSPKPSAATTS